MSRIRKHVVVIVAVALVAGVAVGGVIAAQHRDTAPDVGEMEAAIATTPVTKVADVSANDGSEARGVYLQELDTGYVCVWDAPSSTSRSRQGGCNRADDPLGGSAVWASLAYDGGPATETVRDARLSGLASAETASLEVLMSDGSIRAVKLQKAKVGSDEFQAFGYRFKKADLKKGIGPTAIVAYDAAGNEIGRQPTGIG